MTNDAQIVTPYIIAFRGFSRDLAAVLQGFAQASNCFVVKTLNVTPSPDQPVCSAAGSGAGPGTGCRKSASASVRGLEWGHCRQKKPDARRRPCPAAAGGDRPGACGRDRRSDRSFGASFAGHDLSGRG